MFSARRWQTSDKCCQEGMKLKSFMDGGFILSPAVRCCFYFFSSRSPLPARHRCHLSFAVVLTNLISDSLKLLSGKKTSLQSLYTFPRSLRSVGKDKITLSFLFFVQCRLKSPNSRVHSHAVEDFQSVTSFPRQFPFWTLTWFWEHLLCVPIIEDRGMELTALQLRARTARWMCLILSLALLAYTCM